MLAGPSPCPSKPSNLGLVFWLTADVEGFLTLSLGWRAPELCGPTLRQCPSVMLMPSSCLQLTGHTTHIAFPLGIHPTVTPKP